MILIVAVDLTALLADTLTKYKLLVVDPLTVIVSS